MKKQTLQTNLLGVGVIIGDVTGTQWGPDNESANKEGIIRNVYTDIEGEIKYTVQVKETGKLIELYPSHFRIKAFELGDSV